MNSEQSQVLIQALVMDLARRSINLDSPWYERAIAYLKAGHPGPVYGDSVIQMSLLLLVQDLYELVERQQKDIEFLYEKVRELNPLIDEK